MGKDKKTKKSVSFADTVATRSFGKYEDSGDLSEPVTQRTKTFCVPLFGISKVDKLKETLKDGVDPNITNVKGSTLLHLSISNGNTDFVKALLEEKKTNPNIKNVGGNTPLHLAIDNNKTESVKALLENNRIDPNIQNDAGETPLYLAIVKGNGEFVSSLLKKGGNLLEKGKIKETPLELAYREGNSKVNEQILAHLEKIVKNHAETDQDKDKIMTVLKKKLRIEKPKRSIIASIGKSIGKAFGRKTDNDKAIEKLQTVLEKHAKPTALSIHVVPKSSIQER